MDVEPKLLEAEKRGSVESMLELCEQRAVFLRGDIILVSEINYATQNANFMWNINPHLKHVPHGRTQCMVHEPKVEVAPLLDERGNSGVVRPQREDAFDQIRKGGVCQRCSISQIINQDPSWMKR
jgi:hypothetical protein